MLGLGFRVQGVGFRVWGLGFKVWGLSVYIHDCMGYGIGCRKKS